MPFGVCEMDHPRSSNSSQSQTVRDCGLQQRAYKVMSVGEKVAHWKQGEMLCASAADGGDSSKTTNKPARSVSRMGAFRFCVFSLPGVVALPEMMRQGRANAVPAVRTGVLLGGKSPAKSQGARGSASLLAILAVLGVSNKGRNNADAKGSRETQNFEVPIDWPVGSYLGRRVAGDQGLRAGALAAGGWDEN